MLIRISDPRSLGSWCIKGAAESTLDKDSTVPLMRHGPSDLGSLILIRIIPKECTLSSYVNLKCSFLHFLLRCGPWKQHQQYLFPDPRDGGRAAEEGSLGSTVECLVKINLLSASQTSYNFPFVLRVRFLATT